MEYISVKNNVSFTLKNLEFVAYLYFSIICIETCIYMFSLTS